MVTQYVCRIFRNLQFFSDLQNPLIQVHSAPVTYSYADPRGEKDESIKIVIVGAPGVGKTAIAQDEARTTRKGHMRQVQ